MKQIRYIFFFLLIITVVSCDIDQTATPGDSTQPPAPTTDVPPTMPPTVSPTMPPTIAAEETVRALADTAVLALQARDMTTVADLAHPSKGIRFTPYAYVTDADQTFMANQVQGLLEDTTPYLWGYYDGSGEPIEVPFADYYDAFVYDQDFVNAEIVSVNQPVGSGNSINNSAEFYPDAHIVEYHFSGFNPDYEGMDWVSLRLVFESDAGEWYLVGIIHDQWTI